VVGEAGGVGAGDGQPYRLRHLLADEAGLSDAALSVEADDVHALMECCHGVEEDELDLIIDSAGGSPEAAEQMINYLRTQCSYIRRSCRFSHASR
jgi:hypothetical protein